MLFIFASDDDVRNEQRQANRLPRGASLSPEAARAEHIADEREVRAHRRWRNLAYLLVIAPALVALVAGIVQFVVARFLAAPPP